MKPTIHHSPVAAAVTSIVAAAGASAMLIGTLATATAATTLGAPATVPNGSTEARSVPLPQPECLTTIPTLGPKTFAKVPAWSGQVMVATSQNRFSDENTFERWQQSAGCWIKVSSWWSLNGFNGWSKRPRSGSLRSPMGVFAVTDVGGRLPDPGTSMKYHWGPQRWEAGGYRISYPVQLYNYVIAVNFNRQSGKPPRQNYPLTNTAGSGYWIHQRGLGSTRGCVSLTKSQIMATLQWLDPDEVPYVAMGPRKFLSK